MRYLLRTCLLSALCFAAAPASAGLFGDSEALKQVQQLEARLTITETALVKSEQTISELQELLAKQDAVFKQQTRAMLDLQMSLEAHAVELRKLRGYNEELIHNLQDAEKRQKDFYVDLDGRLRRFEAGDAASTDKASRGKNKTDDLVTENRALEAAYSFYRAERYQNAVVAFQEFLNNFPQSVHTANIRYWMGNAYFVLKEYQTSLDNYQILVDQFSTYPKIADALLNIADCQELLNDQEAANKTLTLITTKHLNTDAAIKAKKRLSTYK